MSFPTPLITAAQLQARLATGVPTQVWDASFDLADTASGAQQHAQAHVPGARHLHLDRDLSAERDGRNGRHPLPSRGQAWQRLRARGWQPALPSVVYDRSGGMYAARAWWMLRWLGGQASVLDGGWQAWVEAGAAVAQGACAAARPTTDVDVGPPAAPPPGFDTDDFQGLRATLGQPAAPLLVDARAPDRFRGENETLDPVGGRIPGAVNRPFRDNLGADGRFLPPALLRQAWGQVLGGRPAAEAVMSCGSGVTACHNLLAMHAAGLVGSRLYPGSWSEWCAQPQAPLARGPA